MDAVKVESFFDRCVEEMTMAKLGNVVARDDIQSSIRPFNILPGYKVTYPEGVIQAFAALYREYNRAFTPLVEANREWDSDYQWCVGRSGELANWGVQIDMVGLPQAFLDGATNMPVSAVVEILRRRIFEIENSLAMYHMLEMLFSDGQKDSFFKVRFRATLADLRRQFDRPIALLAVTDSKYAAMKAIEFGRENGASLSDAEVQTLSGFDRFFGPEEFRRHVEENRGRCEYLLYARTSDPVAKLKDPTLHIDQPLLSNPMMRRIIKAHTLTMNVDTPGIAYGRINDTKEYMPALGMAFRAHAEADLLSPRLAAHLSVGGMYADFKGAQLSDEFASFLTSHGIDSTGDAPLRAKPLKGAYGCYGHVTGPLKDNRFRQELRRNFRRRGEYVIQPEMATPTIMNETDGMVYNYIDRVFFGMIGGRPEFLGGVRSMMPVESVEAQSGRNHGNTATVSGEIIA